MADLASVIAKEEIIDCINRLFINTDRRDWAAVRACLADSVDFDMTSLTGGTPETLPAQKIIDGWEQGLRPIQAIHHQAGNHRVNLKNAAEATVFCYAIALHYRPTRSGRNTRTFVGSYDFALMRLGEQWRITAFRFNCKFLDGNLELEKTE
ncbi:MAG: nuclear transport factor 2 family protein [Sulfurifustaceae bacterium]